MYHSFIILLREVLEISIILSIILAATNGIVGRSRYIIGGVGAGLVGATLLALFTNKISDALNGTGQEIVNAAILLCASFFISWTIIWIKKHGKHLSSRIKQKGQMIKDGNASLISMAFVVALAIFREGSEIVLFTYSLIITSKDNLSNILLGAVSGLSVGIFVGYLFYMGVLQFSKKMAFTRVVTLLLALVAASMAAQGGLFLQSAGYLSFIDAQPLWDSSSLISDASVAGNILNIIIGYSSKPTLIEVLFFLATLFLIWFSIKLQSPQK